MDVQVDRGNGWETWDTVTVNNQQVEVEEIVIQGNGGFDTISIDITASLPVEGDGIQIDGGTGSDTFVATGLWLEVNDIYIYGGASNEIDIFEDIQIPSVRLAGGYGDDIYKINLVDTYAYVEINDPWAGNTVEVGGRNVTANGKMPSSISGIIMLEAAGYTYTTGSNTYYL